MAVPKQRKSKRRTRLRKSTYKASPATYASCPRCHSAIRPHHVCENCGHYKGRVAAEVE